MMIKELGLYPTKNTKTRYTNTQNTIQNCIWLRCVQKEFMGIGQMIINLFSILKIEQGKRSWKGLGQKNPYIHL